MIIIGVDGLDSVLLSRFERDLPTFRRLREQSPSLKFTSVFPPDSVTAWISAYTGLNPASHGVINFIDAADRAKRFLFDNVDNRLFRGRTFWDIAGEFGKRVCVVLPYAVFPPYQVNGVMICRTLSEDQQAQPIQAFPSSICNKYEISSSSLLLFHGFPSKRQLGSFVESCHERTLAEAKLGLKVLKNEEWDLFFIYFSAIDAIQHTFWSYYDEKHPDYPGRSPYSDIIREFYILCDSVVAEFVRHIDPDATLILLSDHGHGTRPTRMVKINEILRRKGLLFPKTVGLKNNTFIQPGYTKKVLADLVNRFGVGHSSLRLMQKFPVWKRIFTSPASVDWEKTVAYVSDLSALKSYSYGGVMINKKSLNDKEYEEIRCRLISELRRIEEPISGENLMKWIRPREELYQGNYLGKYPDILFELEEEYGISWDLGGNIFAEGYMHKIQPGSHKMQSPVLLISKKDNDTCVKKDCTLMDIAPTVLSLLGIKNDFGFEGSSIVQRSP